MNAPLLRGRPVVVLVAALFAARAPAQNAAPRPQLYAIKDVRLVDQPDAPRKSIVLRDGRIESILDAGATPPIGAREVEGQGMLVVPAFVDAYTQAGCETPTPNPDVDAPPSEAADVQIDMRQANRKGIQPAFRAADVFALPADKSKPWRESGFGALVSAPTGQLLAGTSALCTTREAAMRDTILVPELFAHAAFRAGGGGYPSTLMGYFAQMRQFFLDVEHHAELQARYAAGRPGPRPPFDAELEAGLGLANKQRRVFCDAESAQDIRRWIALADELGLEIGITGGREAWKVAELLKQRDIPVVLTLEWGDEPKDPHEKDKKAKKAETAPEEPKQADARESEADAPRAQLEQRIERFLEDQEAAKQASDEPKPDDKKADDKKKWEYEEPLGVREKRRALWEEGRDCAKTLHAAGVAFTFGSASSSGAELLKKVRTAVESGLPAEVALAGLTSGAAKQVGAEKHLGAIAPGMDANLALWTADPTAKDAKCAWLFVDGFANEFEIKADDKAEGKPDEGVDASGTWTVEIKSDQGTTSGSLTLTMTPDGDVTGSLTTTSQRGERTIEVKGHVGGKAMTLEGSFSMRETEITNKWKVELDGDALAGTSTTRGPWGETSSEVSGTRTPKYEDLDEVYQEGCGDEHP